MASNVEIVKKLYTDFAEKNMDGLMAAMAPDVEWTVSDGFPYGGTYIGFQAIMENVFAKIPGDWDGFRHELHNTVECGDDVLVSGTYYGTWKATGKDMEAPFVHHCTVQGGVLVRFHQYVDLPTTEAATDGFMHAAVTA